jgi:hypothetical protein
MDWETVKALISRSDRGKSDVLVRPKDIRWLDCQGLILADLDGIGICQFSSWAESQLCNRLGIPVKYFRECPGELKRMQLSYWLDHGKGERLWRLRLQGKTIRAVLSDAYQPLDNAKIIDLWEETGDAARFDYEPMLDDTSLYLRAILPDGKESGGRQVSQDALGGLRTGVYVRNSEVGRSAVSAGACVYRLVCKNGMVVYGENRSFYKRHIWIDGTVLAARLGHAIAYSLDLAQKGTLKMAWARAVPVKARDLPAYLYPLPIEESLSHRAADVFLAQGDWTLFGLVNAVTSVARGLPPNERFETERAAGRLLERAA